MKNEKRTIIPCLNSLDGVFDRLVIIHDNSFDDGTNKLIENWCKSKNICSIYTYPYPVVPSHVGYTPKPENSLAKYNEFGLSKINPEEYVVKIDADTIYINSRLKNLVEQIRKQDKVSEDFRWGMRGYNTFPFHNKLVKYKPGPINGGVDHYVVKRKYILGFTQKENYEVININPKLSVKILPELYWFHFFHAFRMNGQTRPIEDAQENETLSLTEKEKDLFELNIRPLLQLPESTYYKDIML